MKNFCFSLLVTIALFFSSISSISAQPYESYFGESSTRWTIVFEWNTPFCELAYGTAHVDYIGDSTAQGIAYKKMAITNQLSAKDTFLFREDTAEGKLIYCYLNFWGNYEEITFADLSINAQDSLVESIYYVNNKKHIRLKEKLTFASPFSVRDSNLVFIEGIGSNSYFRKNDVSLVGMHNVLLCVEKDGIQAFKHSFIDLPDSCAFDTFSCTSSSSTFSIINRSFNIYPNPNSGIFNLQFQEEILPNSQIAIFDLMGKMVLQSNFYGNRQEIDANHLPNGVYFIQIKSLDSGQILGSERLIINK